MFGRNQKQKEGKFQLSAASLSYLVPGSSLWGTVPPTYRVNLVSQFSLDKPS